MDGPWIVAYAVQWGFLVLLGFLVFVLYHELGRSYLGSAQATTRDGLRVGAKAPTFTALDPQGDPVEFSPLADGDTMLIFGAAGCAMCERLLPELDEFNHEYGGLLRILLVFRTGPHGAGAGGRYETSVPMWTVTSNAALMRYKVRVTPFGFVIGRNGVIRAKGLVNGRDHLEYLSQMASDGTRASETQETGMEEMS